MAPSALSYGESMPAELERLVEAGPTHVEALQAATVLAARAFRLGDRGVVEPGRRADLLLVAGDPTTDIGAVRDIRAVWVAGVQAR